jgi:hypothetical protein
MVAPPLLKILKDQKSARKCPTMNLSLSQRDTTCRPIDRRRRGAWLRRSLPSLKLSRLRRRGPRWMLAALLLLLAGDVVLAITVWLIVKYIVR